MKNSMSYYIDFRLGLVRAYRTCIDDRGYMTLTRGPQSNFPCVYCLVPKELLHEIWRDFERRTGEKALAKLEEARQQPLATVREAILKNWGLRAVDVSALIVVSCTIDCSSHYRMFSSFTWRTLIRIWPSPSIVYISIMAVSSGVIYGL